MRLVSLVALGGAVGSVLRYWLTIAVHSVAGITFPIGTLIVNISGAFVLGFVMRFSLQSSAITPELRILLTTGLCGGFTTFSAFSYESARLIESGKWSVAVSYAVLSVVLSVAGIFLGFRAAQLFRGGLDVLP